MDTLKRIVILEDDLLVADHLRSILSEGGYEVLGSFDKASLLLDFLKEQPADIALLDVKIKGDLDGVETAHILNEEYGLPIAFLTSNTDLATAERVKETLPMAYIAKPYTAEGVLSALEVSFHRLESVKQSLEEVSPSEGPEISQKHIYVRSKKELLRISFSEITHVQAMDNYCIIHRSDAERLVVPRTLKHMEEELSPHGFSRIHRSYLANTDRVDRISASEVHLKEVSLPLSESYRPALLGQLRTL